MSFLDAVKQGISNHFEKRKEDREMMEKIQKEADIEARIVFEREYKANALQVAIGQAKKNAASKSGLQKLRAMNRVRNLEKTNPQDTGNFFQRLSVYTQKNIARREDNLEKTEMLRSEAKKIKTGNLQRKSFERNQPINNRIRSIPFSRR